MAIVKKPEEFWVTNVNRNKDVSITDLGVVVRRGRSINLFATDKKGRLRYNISKEMILKSAESGSIKNKKDIKVRKVAPVTFNTRIDIVNKIDKNLTRAQRITPEVEIPDFPDLDFEEANDEAFAAENADMDFIDRMPSLIVDPKFKNLAEDDE